MNRRRTHVRSLLNLCPICNKELRGLRTLNTHMKDVHHVTRNFTCNECGRIFTRRHNLIVHRRVHDDTRRFECDLCHARFTQESNLARHVYTKHENPWMCSTTGCHARFKSEDDTMMHINEVHPGATDVAKSRIPKVRETHTKVEIVSCWDCKMPVHSCGNVRRRLDCTGAMLGHRRNTAMLGHRRNTAMLGHRRNTAIEAANRATVVEAPDGAAANIEAPDCAAEKAPKCPAKATPAEATPDCTTEEIQEISSSRGGHTHRNNCVKHSHSQPHQPRGHKLSLARLPIPDHSRKCWLTRLPDTLGACFFEFLYVKEQCMQRRTSTDFRRFANRALSRARKTAVVMPTVYSRQYESSSIELLHRISAACPRIESFRKLVTTAWCDIGPPHRHFETCTHEPIWNAMMVYSLAHTPSARYITILDISMSFRKKLRGSDLMALFPRLEHVCITEVEHYSDSDFADMWQLCKSVPRVHMSLKVTYTTRQSIPNWPADFLSRWSNLCQVKVKLDFEYLNGDHTQWTNAALTLVKSVCVAPSRIRKLTVELRRVAASEASLALWHTLRRQVVQAMTLKDQVVQDMATTHHNTAAASSTLDPPCQGTRLLVDTLEMTTSDFDESDAIVY